MPRPHEQRSLRRGGDAKVKTWRNSILEPLRSHLASPSVQPASRQQETWDPGYRFIGAAMERVSLRGLGISFMRFSLPSGCSKRPRRREYKLVYGTAADRNSCPKNILVRSALTFLSAAGRISSSVATGGYLISAPQLPGASRLVASLTC